MTGEIKIHLVKVNNRPYWYMRYTDPVMMSLLVRLICRVKLMGTKAMTASSAEREMMYSLAVRGNGQARGEIIRRNRPN
jgi:hypothetical protein